MFDQWKKCAEARLKLLERCESQLSQTKEELAYFTERHEKCHQDKDAWKLKAERLAEVMKHIEISCQSEMSWYKWKAKEALDAYEEGENG